MAGAAAIAAGPMREAEVLDLRRDRALLDGVTGVERHAFCTAPWLRAWESAFLPGDGWRGPMRVHAALADGECIGFVPLAEQRIHRLSVASLGGYYWPYRTVCADADAARRARFAAIMADHFTRHPPAAVLRFGPVMETDEGMCALLDALVQAGWLRLQKEGGENFAQYLPDDPAQLHACMSPSLLKNINYRRRRIVRTAGEIGFERCLVQGDCDALLRDLQHVERASWQGNDEGGTPKFVGAAAEKFWRALARAHPYGARPVVWLMRCAGRPIAYQVVIETAEVIYKIGSCYDTAWRTHSPGSLLTYEIFSDACRRGIRHIDWGRGDSGYKSTWGGAVDGRLYEVLLFRPGMVGRAALALARRALPGWEVADRFADERGAVRGDAESMAAPMGER
jgi:CelD/BcsL family acetyltransferase involved in cellulose biosynthesis